MSLGYLFDDGGLFGRSSVIPTFETVKDKFKVISQPVRVFTTQINGEGWSLHQVPGLSKHRSVCLSYNPLLLYVSVEKEREREGEGERRRGREKERERGRERGKGLRVKIERDRKEEVRGRQKDRDRKEGKWIERE